MAHYNIEKKLKTAEIGTVLPWAGDQSSRLRGYENDSKTGIPDGWIICDGREEACTSYPLLAQVIGDTYGGTITGSFPNYNAIDTFKIPNIQNRHLADYDVSYLPANAEVQAAITPLMGTDTDNSIDVTPSVSADINFSVAASNSLVGKSTNMAITDPSYFKILYTVNRKLGQNHTPSHNHTGDLTTVLLDGVFAELFQQPTPQYESNGQQVQAWLGTGAEASPSTPDLLNVDTYGAGNSFWINLYNAATTDQNRLYVTNRVAQGNLRVFNSTDEGRTRYSIYSLNGDTHVTTDGAKSFNNTSVANQPMETGSIPQKASNYPYLLAGTGFAKNWSNLNAAGTNTTFATTINHNYDQSGNNDFPSGHNHGGIEITMNRAGLKPPKTVYHNDVQTHNIAPQNIASALTMNIDAETPSLNILYIIRAY